jgi:hypothetical protein
MPNGKIYDPSYGSGSLNDIGFTDINDWEKSSISGYAFESMYFNPKLKQGIFIVWPIKNNPDGKDIEFSCN